MKSSKDISTRFSVHNIVIIGCVFVFILKLLTFYIETSNETASVEDISSVEFGEYREHEIKDHIKTFHQSFWSFDQYSLPKNMRSALHLIGNSGKQLYLSMKANGHFSKIRSQNLVQTLLLESLVINTRVEPYKCAYYGKLKIRRADQVKEKVEIFTAFFDVHHAKRTDFNPYGLLIDNYDVNIVPIRK